MRSLCATLVAIVCVAAGAPAAWATFPGSDGIFPGLNGQLAYEAGSGATRNVSTIQPLAGLSLEGTPLTPARTIDRDAAWSADGRRIAFMSERDGNPEIYVMNATPSSLPTRLTFDPAADVDPTFSRDGTRLAFTSTRDGNPEIYVMADDGSGQTRLTFDPAADQQADWSPDGTRIAFESTRDGNHEIYAMNPDGGAVTRLTFSPEFAADPSWHPDGASIAFVSGPSGALDVFTLRPGTAGRTRLTRGANDAHHPAWSPDGQQIAFTASGNTYVRKVDASGIGEVAANGVDAAWGPLPPPTRAPEFRKTMNVEATSGTVFVRMQGTAAAAPLRPEEAGEIPVGSARCGPDKPASTCTVIDTSQGGELEINAATTASETSTSSVAVSEGRATLSQTPGGIVYLQLPRPHCPPGGERVLNQLHVQTPPEPARSAASRGRSLRKIKKKGKDLKVGGSNSKGRSKRTEWTTVDTCGSTITRVQSGVVEVTDLTKPAGCARSPRVRCKRVLVGPGTEQGPKYTARPRR